jgi:replicative DNA helicase
MTEQDVLGRIAGIIAGFNPQELRKKTRDPQVDASFTTAKHRFQTGKGKVKVIPPVSTVSEIAMYVRQDNYDVVAIDGVYLLTAETDRKTTKSWETLTQVAYGLKNLAIQTRLPIVGVSQKKRSDGTADTNYSTDDISYSDALSQAIDAGIRMKMDLPGNRFYPGKYSATLTKNRNGPTGTQDFLRIDWNTMRCDFEDRAAELAGGATSDPDDAED